MPRPYGMKYQIAAISWYFWHSEPWCLWSGLSLNGELAQAGLDVYECSDDN